MVKGGPQVTIGMPVFNGERYLQEAVRSILGQSFTDFELIIADNASTDGSGEMIREMEAADSRVRAVWSDENRGAAWNYNRLVELARAPYFKWAAHDDVLCATYLERCVEALECDPDAVLCYPGTVIVDDQGSRVGAYEDDLRLDDRRASDRFRRFHQRYRTRGLCNPVCGVIRTETLRATLLIGSYVGSDRILLAELALRGRFVDVEEPLFCRREHPDSSSKANVRADELAVWFDPANTGRRQFRHHKWFREYWRAVSCARLPWLERCRCRLTLMRWCWWKRGRLVRESKSRLKQVLLRQSVASSNGVPAETHEYA